MDWTITAKKMLAAFLHTSTGIVVTALLAWYSDEVHLKQAMEGMPNQLAILLIPIVSALLRGFGNWWKNQLREEE